MYQVDIKVQPNIYDSGDSGPVWWNVHSDFNSGYRATEAMWSWLRLNRVEVDQWDILQYYDDFGDVKPGLVTFEFEDKNIATLFKLTWA